MRVFKDPSLDELMILADMSQQQLDLMRRWILTANNIGYLAGSSRKPKPVYLPGD